MGGYGQTGTTGVNPSTHTSLQRAAPLNATRRHREAHLFYSTQHYLKKIIVHEDRSDVGRITVFLFH